MSQWLNVFIQSSVLLYCGVWPIKNDSTSETHSGFSSLTFSQEQNTHFVAPSLTKLTLSSDVHAWLTILSAAVMLSILLWMLVPVCWGMIIITMLVKTMAVMMIDAPFPLPTDCQKTTSSAKALFLYTPSPPAKEASVRDPTVKQSKWSLDTSWPWHVCMCMLVFVNMVHKTFATLQKCEKSH